MSANILNIGSVVKHRGIYDKDTVYYKDNQVTMCGSLFQAISSNFKGVAPLAEASDGTVTLVNKIFWKCIIDKRCTTAVGTEAEVEEAQTFQPI